MLKHTHNYQKKITGHKKPQLIISNTKACLNQLNMLKESEQTICNTDADCHLSGYDILHIINKHML